MRTLLLLLTFILLRSFAFCQVNDEYAFLLGTYDKAFIKSGRIESIKVSIEIGGQTITRQYSFDSVGNLVHIISKDSGGKKINESFLQYDHFGSKVFQKNFDYEKNTADSSSFEFQYTDGKVVKEFSQSPNSSKEYTYNKVGQIERTVTKNSFGDLTETLHSYDAKGNEIEYVWIEGTTKKITKNTYDDKNRMIESKETFYASPDTIGELFLHKKYSCGGNGKIAKEEFLGGYFDFDNEAQEFIYDQNENLIEQKSGKIKKCFTYDKQGLLIKKETPVSGMMKSIETYNYTFRK